MSAIQMAVLLMVSGGATPFKFTPTISADTLNYNLRAAAVAAGWNQTDPLIATVTVNSGIYVGSSSTGAYGFDTGATFPAGTTLTLVNNGMIVGAGCMGVFARSIKPMLDNLFISHDRFWIFWMHVDFYIRT